MFVLNKPLTIKATANCDRVHEGLLNFSLDLASKLLFCTDSVGREARRLHIANHRAAMMFFRVAESWAQNRRRKITQRAQIRADERQPIRSAHARIAPPSMDGKMLRDGAREFRRLFGLRHGRKLSPDHRPERPTRRAALSLCLSSALSHFLFVFWPALVWCSAFRRWLHFGSTRSS